MITDRNSLRSELREKFPRNHGQLLPALHFIQHEFGHLPDWAMEVVGWHLGIPSSEVYGAATSYTELRVEKPGNTVVRVCTALSCVVSGSQAILTALETELSLDSGNTSDNREFTLEETAVRISLRHGSRHRDQRPLAWPPRLPIRNSTD